MEQGFFEGFVEYKLRCVQTLRMMGVEPFFSDDNEIIDTTLGAIKDLPPEKPCSDGPNVPPWKPDYPIRKIKCITKNSK